MILKDVLERLNNEIAVLNSTDWKLYDTENPGHYIKGIKYNADKDVLEFECMEE